MTDPDHVKEPLQRLPPGIPRQYAEYKPASTADTAPPPTNVGGYEELLVYFQARGQELARSRSGLAAIDQLIERSDDKPSLAQLAQPIGMFYGDVLTHTVPGAHWEVVVESDPGVRVSRDISISVMAAAERRLTIGAPTLVQNYDHILDVLAGED